MKRQISWLFIVVLTVVWLLGAVSVQTLGDFPDREITLIVPWPAGGGSDTIMRLLAQHAERHFGVPVVVVNQPGAAAGIGTRNMSLAEPDGYTVGMVGSGVLARQYIQQGGVPIDQLQPIVLVGAESSALTVRSDSPWQTLEDFIRDAERRPGQILNANDPPGGASFIAVAMLEQALGIELNRIPYQGFAPSVVALVSREVDSTTVPVPDVVDLYNEGKFRILGVMDTSRHFKALDVPTFQEQGYDLVQGLWRSIIGPRGIPWDRLRTLEQGFLATLNDPAFVEAANRAGFQIAPLGTQDTIDRWLNDDTVLLPILQELGLVVNNPRE
ncbi:MAG: tripartite tricarboxylate transporter substrate binding protein [Candidatus Bipolaricaulia bacterium]